MPIYVQKTERPRFRGLWSSGGRILDSRSRGDLKGSGVATDTPNVTTVPPPLEQLLNSPVLRSEMPAGFERAKVSAPGF